ncbi:MAG: two-component regulator propeller domain-containing protein, partial [Rhodothermales bacterium]|nr:two-component regulator propeller domain-containing protein [Rhodothermales bacterium]
MRTTLSIRTDSIEAQRRSGRVRGSLAALAAGLLLLLMPSDGRAQHFPFRTLTIDDGLAQSQATTLYQDSRGYLWIGTYAGGLSRFDGHQFVQYSRRHGLPSSHIRAVVEDRHGTLWVGTARGAARLEGATVRPVPLGGAEADVYALVEDRDGTLWFGTDRGLFRLRGASRGAPPRQDAPTPERIAPGVLPSEPVYALAEDAAGRLWAGT